ncbi:MAG TPA: hypothetical protein VFM46_07855 [Pseudomonadales bacterium]|nr:hypothetical protein [Pseudomonadales bacterium]
MSRSVHIQETVILHANDVVFWLDGTSAEATADMQRLNLPLRIDLTSAPRDVSLVNTRGKTAFLRRPTNPVVNGTATENDKKIPVTPTFAIAGVVSDPTDRIVPQAFSFNAGNAAGHTVTLYPTPVGARFGNGGGLTGSLRLQPANTALPWAILSLAVTTAVGTTLTFKGQTNRNGDFSLPLNRLPPLPKGVNHYHAQLSINGMSNANPDIPLNPDNFVAMQVGSLTANSFSLSVGLTIVPGEMRVIRSFNRDHLAVQP